MNEQEMQFADPDWKPTGSLHQKSEDAVTMISAPSSSVSGVSTEPQSGEKEQEYSQGYRGSDRPYFVPSNRQYSPLPINRGRVVPSRSYWWIWLIALIILFSIVGSLGGWSHESFPKGGPGPGHSFFQRGPNDSTQSFKLGGASQVNVEDPFGSITVQVGAPDDQSILLQSDSNASAAYNSNTITISPDSDNSDMTIEVPQGIALNLETSSGDIEVDGFNGQIVASTDSGQISLNQDALSGQSVINAGSSGDIDFSGTLAAGGNYQFTTGDGDITLNLPEGTALQIQHQEGPDGSYNSDFPSQSGSGSRASVTVTTNSGSTEINGK